MEQVSIDKKAQPVKRLIKILKKHSGRDSTGSISVRHRGGRQKRYYRLIDFKREKRNMEGEVIRIEKDPNRNAYIALIKYPDGVLNYILAPLGLKPGEKIIAAEQAEIKTGNALPLKNIPLGVLVHNVELYPGSGSQMVRGAGTAAQVLAKEGGFVHLKLPSGEIRKVSENCYASIGQLSKEEHNIIKVGKAGRKRHMGIRPTVRGSAMNTVDHPYGGGEGKTQRGTRRPKDIWGNITGGRKTRKKDKYSKNLIVQRRPKKK